MCPLRDSLIKKSFNLRFFERIRAIFQNNL
jgi:hypothetical protein